MGMWQKNPRIERQGAKKEVCFVYRILDFHFYSKFVLFMVLRGVLFNVTTSI
jgi:hypothetical protein